jgi:hypothetical protein
MAGRTGFLKDLPKQCAYECDCFVCVTWVVAVVSSNT